MANLSSLYQDSQFQSLPESDKADVITGIVGKDPDFQKLGDKDKADVLNGIMAKGREQWTPKKAPTKEGETTLSDLITGGTKKASPYETHPLKGGPSPKIAHEVPSYSLNTLQEFSKPIGQDDYLTGMAEKKQQYQKELMAAKADANADPNFKKFSATQREINKQLSDPKTSPDQVRNLQIKAAAYDSVIREADTNIVDALGMALPLAPIKLEAMVTKLISMGKGSLTKLAEIAGRSAKARQQAVNELIDHGHDPEHAKTAVDAVIEAKSKPAMGPIERTMPTEKEGLTPAKSEHVWQATARQHDKEIAAQFPKEDVEHIEAAPAPKEVEPLYTPEHHTTLKNGEPVVFFHQSTPTGHVVHAENPDTGEHLGKVEFTPHRTEPGKWEGNVFVQEQHRGKLVGSGLYQHAEERMGLDIAPSIHQTDAGKAFTAARERAKAEQVPPTNSETPPSIFPEAPVTPQGRRGRRRMGYPDEVVHTISNLYKGERGFGDIALMVHGAGAIGGALTGAAQDKEHPYIGALEGAALGLSATTLAHFGVGKFAKLAKRDNLNLSDLVSRYTPDLTTITNTKQLSDAFFWSKASSHADSAIIAQHIDHAAKTEVPAHIDKMFRDASEGSIKLNPKGQEIYDRTVQPLRNIVNSVRAKYGAAADAVIKDLGTRIALNHRTWLDSMLEGGADRAQGGAQRLFSGKPGASKARTVFATDDGHIVTTKHVPGQWVEKDGKKYKQPSQYKLTLWKDGEVVGTRMSKVKPTDGVEVGDVKLRQAKQADIEQHSPVRYVQSDLAVWGLRAKEMLKYDRDQELLKAMLNSKDSEGVSLFPHENEGMHNIPEDYRKLKGDAAAIPQLQGRYMPANLAEVIEDAAKANKAGISNFINDTVIRSMMLNPFPHVANEFMHWWDARGASGWITPTGLGRVSGPGYGASKGWYGLYKTMPDSIKSVLTYDKFQVELQQHGGSLMAPSRREAANMDKILQYSMKEAMKSGSLRTIAQSLGMSPFRLMKKISNGSSSLMWSIRDIFYTQLVKEQMMMGKNMREAIDEVGRHMPTYRLPPRVLGSRKVSQFMQSPLVVFSPYHHGLLSSLGEIGKEIASPVIKGHSNEFVKGMDRLGALVAASTMVVPYIDSIYQAHFGQPGGTVKQRRAGPLHTIEGVEKTYDDPSYQNFAYLAMGIVTPSPVMTIAPELMSNRSLLTGRPIMKPGREEKDALRYMASKLKPADVASRIGEGKLSTEAALLSVMDVIEKNQKQVAFEENLKKIHRAQRATERARQAALRAAGK